MHEGSEISFLSEDIWSGFENLGLSCEATERALNTNGMVHLDTGELWILSQAPDAG